MQMIDRLAGVAAAVSDHAISIVEFQLFGQLTNHDHQVTQKRDIVIADGRQRGDFLARNDDHVDRGLRRDIVKRHAEIILMHEPRGDLTVDDALEDRLFAHVWPRRTCRRQVQESKVAWFNGMASSRSIIGISSTTGYKTRP